MAKISCGALKTCFYTSNFEKKSKICSFWEEEKTLVERFDDHILKFLGVEVLWMFSDGEGQCNQVYGVQ